MNMKIAIMLDEKRSRCAKVNVVGVESGRVKYSLSIFSQVVAVLSFALSADASTNVTQLHNNLSRDGLYIAPAFTQSASASLMRDTGFDGTIRRKVDAANLARALAG